MAWTAPSFPHQPQGAQRMRVVTGARLSAVRRGRLRVVRSPNRWITGAVHDDKGRLLPISQKLGGLGGHQVAMADPARVELERWAPRLRGRWLYGGHWMMHFGHFLTETVTTLWPEDLEPVEGLVFHRYLAPHPSVSPWQQRLVDLAGYADLPIRFVNERQMRVDELVVPSRSIIQHGWGRPGAAAVWRRIAAGVEAQDPPVALGTWPSRVFLTRSSFNAGKRAKGRHPPRTSPEHDALLDEVFAEAGFEVVAPELLPIDDQVRLIVNSNVLAGLAGSALHLAGFARPGTRVLELGDTRSLRQGVPTQRVVNTLCGLPASFLPQGLGREELTAELHELGVWQSDPAPEILPG